MYRGAFVYMRGADSSLTLESAVFSGGRLTGASVLMYATDYLGSVRAVVDGRTGELYKAVDYSAYGEETVVEAAGVSGGITLRDGYTGKENQHPDFGTSYTDFGARQYYPQLHRWMTPDPLSEKYYGVSPYAFCNNDPVNFVDLDGRYFNKASDRKAKQYEKKLENKANKLAKRASRLENRGEDLGDLTERSKELQKSVQDIKDMRNDPNAEYRFLTNQEPKSTIIGCNDSNDEVIALYSSDFETRIHEIRHGGQHARGEIDLATGQNYGVNDEVDAYRAQYAWLGTYRYIFDDMSTNAIMRRRHAGIDLFFGTINNINLITPNFVNHLIENGQYLYPPVGTSLADWIRH